MVKLILIAALALQAVFAQDIYPREHYHEHQREHHGYVGAYPIHYHEHRKDSQEYLEHGTERYQGLQHVNQESGEHHHDHHRDTQELLQYLRSISHNAVNAIQNVHVRDGQVIHALYSQAHELAHNVHEVAYHLQQVVYHNVNGQGRDILQQVVVNLYDIVHGIQRSMHHDPIQFQARLRVQIENLVTEAGKLGTVAQQSQSAEDVNNELLVVLDDLLAAIQQFYVRSRIQYQNPQDIRSHLENTVNEVSNTIQSVNTHDEDDTHHIVHYCHHLAHHLNDIIRKLERESHHHHGEVRHVLGQVVNNLSEIRSTLEQAERNNSIDELRAHLKNSLRQIATEIEKLVQLAHSDKLVEHESCNLKNVVHNILAHALASARQLQRNVQHIVDHKSRHIQEN